MPDKDSELRVVRQSRDGRRRYDEKGKRALVEAALQPGVSVARMAQERGINANLLRKWITKYLLDREKGISPAPQQEVVADHHEAAPATEVIDGVAIDLPGSHKVASPARTSSAFIPVVSAPPALLPEGSASPRTPIPSSSSMTLALHVRLSNGVEFDIADATIDELATVVQMLGRMPCSGSTRI
ncbi:transposase [Paraburkholderia lycopersici]|uniref:transposase n=1 Tax=Paraburkholderia lycopersici TaxID=416944 RepID=UPI000A9641F4|nr:transposase [Paraburkholderia lycopersici]